MTARVHVIISRIRNSLTFRTLVVFASANILVAVVQGVCGLLQARWISPATMGEFTKYGILTGYSAFLLVPVQDGLIRQFPYLVGKGKKDEAIAVAGVAKTWYIIVFICMAIAFGSLSITSLISKNYMSAVGWAAQIPAVCALSFGTWMQTIYRRSMEFKRLSYNGLIASAVSAVGLIFSYVYGFTGVAARAMLTNITRLIYDYKHMPMKIKVIWNKRHFVDLVRISIPLSIVGYIRTSFLTATFSYLVLKYCGKADLGVYGMAVTFQSFAMMFNTSLSQMFGVKYAQKFGETESLRKTMISLFWPTVFGVVAATVLSGILCALISPFITTFIPKYTASIPVIYVLSIGIPLQALGLAPGIMKMALMYKTIYFIGCMKVFAVVVAVMLLPKTIVWMASAMMIGELTDVVLGWIFLIINSQDEKTI